QDSEFSNADQMDLYDDVLAASSQPSENRTPSSEAPPEIRQEPSPKPNSKPPAILYTYSGLRNKRAAVYVGSFSWWTTDQQLIQTIRSVGVYDVVELKFAENRANGQSKGYAEVVVASENSVHKLLELLPGKILNGDKVEVRLATRQNLSQFEAQARKRELRRKRVTPWGDLQLSCQTEPTRALRVGGTLPGLRPSIALSNSSLDLLQNLSIPAEVRCPTLDPIFQLGPGPWGFLQWQSVVLASLRSDVTPQPRAGELCGAAGTGQERGRGGLGQLLVIVDSHGPFPARKTFFLSTLSRSRAAGTSQPPSSTGDEIMNRNRAISSSAISKAVSGASAGDYSDAIETLLTAIAVIKQSRVANDERCRVLLSSLKDCLHGIEAKSYSTSSSSSSSRKRHRSRERSPSRSRESSRRHRDLLHSEDRHDDYFQERNRDHERHRDRDRDRDR
ncbi:CPSF7 factor, partial [Syrrhaptes paradoxus]|nr:CPSF7 factor [Syrrhaptes paradoxus]